MYFHEPAGSFPLRPVPLPLMDPHAQRDITENVLVQCTQVYLAFKWL